MSLMIVKHCGEPEWGLSLCSSVFRSGSVFSLSLACSSEMKSNFCKMTHDINKNRTANFYG